MKGAETKRRLSEAFKADKYVLQLQQKMQGILAYSAMPFNNEPPEAYKTCHEMLIHYTKDWWGDLLEDTRPKSDLAMAMGWSMIAYQSQKLLTTKHNNGKSILENIDIRLSVYSDYSWYRLNVKNWEYTPERAMKDYKLFGWLMYNEQPEPMTYAQWLYRSGYESLLTDAEFLSAIRYFDNENEPEERESDWLRDYRLQHGFTMMRG